MRIALLGFSIECNRFAPVATEADFSARTLLSGQAMLDEARSPAPRMLGELPGFLAAMDAAGAWQPVPIVLAMAEPNGPVDQAFFDRLMAQWETGLRAAGQARRRLLRAARRRPDDRRTTTRKARCSRWSAASSATASPSSPPTTCTPTSRTPTSHW